MSAQAAALFQAVTAGDLGQVEAVLAPLSPDSRTHVLGCRQEESAVAQRPSTGQAVYVRSPTPLLLAVAGWYPDIVQYLSSFQVRLH